MYTDSQYPADYKYPGGDAAYSQQHHHNKPFTCEQCAEGEVQFGPGSNLELVWDGGSWTLRLIDNGSGARNTASKKSGNNITARKGGSANAVAKKGSNGNKAGGISKPRSGGSSSKGSNMRSISKKQQQPDKLGLLVGAGTQGKASDNAIVQAYGREYQQAYASSGDGSQPDVGGIAPPYYGGQCVPCPEGSHVEGIMCKYQQ